MNITFHYPSELLSLLIDTIALLFRSKPRVLLFFAEAGVDDSVTRDLADRVRADRSAVTKFEIVRVVLTRLNQRGERSLRERREVLRRVVEFEDFSTCWPGDQLKVKGLVAEIRRVVNVKDSFTRMHLEREAEREKHQAQQREKLAKVQRRQQELLAVKADLFGLFGEQDAQRRGRGLEQVMTRLFQLDGVLVREPFTRVGQEGEGVVEQVDGVIALDGQLYLVEVKWWNQPLGKGQVSEHLVRIFGRGQARGILISASGYTRAAVTICRESLSQTVVVLCELEEIVMLLEQEADFGSFLRQKVEAAVAHKNPHHRPLSASTP